MVALPLSRPFLKWMAGRSLGLADLVDILPTEGRFLINLQDIVLQKRAIDADPTLNEEERKAHYAALQVTVPGTQAAACDLDDLYLSFVHTPSSKVYGYAEYELW